MAKNTRPSAVYQLLSLVWENTNAGTGDSWERLNRSMREAMKLAITAGFPFVSDDFMNAMDDFRGHRWLNSEGSYSLAVEAGNLSACQAFEAWKDREPFIADNVTSYAYNSGTTRKRGRLTIGCMFPWRGQYVTVTRFADDGMSLTACAYKASDCEYSQKVAKRFRITVAGIREHRERTRLYARLNKAMKGTLQETLEKRFGIATKDDWFAAPIKKIRTVVKELEKEAKD